MDEIKRLLIERECTRLVLLAAEYADNNQAERLSALFTEDAVLVRPNAVAPLQGRQAIALSYSQRPAGRLSRHLVSNTRVEVLSMSEASATSYVLVWLGSTKDEAGPQGRPAEPRQMVGEFRDSFALTPSGWRIARREAVFTLHSGA